MDKANSVIEALTIDCVIFGFDGELKVLLIKHKEGPSIGRWALPGGWIKYCESLDEAAERVLSDLTGVKNIYLQQLKAFGETHRYPDKRVITIAYYSMVKPEKYSLIPGFTASEVKWFSLKELRELPYDHEDILNYGLRHLRKSVLHEPIGFNLLPEKFSLYQLQQLYEAILGLNLDKPNFRRKMLKMNLLIDCKEKQKHVAHRAANLYRFDLQVYEKLKNKGFHFEII
ncbi:MAG: NUDIX domain-containing protein [Cyclobacteriaceae bacterium]|nr:NUDIX domain-containing protein [Cyclobacteriaceae bacterium]